MLRRRRRHLVWLALALVAGALLGIPHLSAERFANALREDLHAMLGRPVEMGEVRFTLWRGPGFLVRDLVIADQADMPAEPFAYVQEATLHVALSSIWMRELRFSSITLSQPSLNLAPTPDGVWNYQRLLPGQLHDALMRDALDTRTELPEVRIEGGRINFRQGLRKSEYYLRNADFRLREEGIGSDAWLLDFRAEPARTDSFAPRFGTIRGNGRWRATAGPHGELDIDVEVERSPLAELSALLGLSRVGMSGYLSARAHLSGPASALQLRGSLDLRDSNSWSLLAGPSANRSLALAGNVDLVSRRVQVSTVELPDAPLPYAATVQVSPPEAPRHWLATLELKQIPVRSLQDLMAAVEQSMPAYDAVEGHVNGQLTYRSDAGLQGSLEATRLDWKPEAQTPFSLRDVKVALGGGSVHGSAWMDAPASPLAAEADAGVEAADQGPVSRQKPDAIATPPPQMPSSTVTPPRTTNNVQWGFQVNTSTGEASFRLQGQDIRPAHLQAQALLVPGAPLELPPLQGDGWVAQGQLQYGQLSFRDAGAWQGQLAVRDFQLNVQGLMLPVAIQRGALEVRGGTWQVRNAQGSAGGIPFRVEISKSPAAARPYRGELRFADLDLEDLSRVLPMSPPDAPGFLQRAFRRTSSGAGNLATAEAFHTRIYARSVLINGSKYSNFRADVFGHGRKVGFENISFSSRFGDFRGQAELDLSSRIPAWWCSLSGQLANWQDGDLEVQLERNARGGLNALFGAAAGSAHLVWRGPQQPEGAEPTTLRAFLEWRDGKWEPEICEYCVELRNANGVWLGSCNQSNGTDYRCTLQDPRTQQQLELELPISMVGVQAK